MVLTVSSVLVDVAHGLREGFFMFWETLWALVLGFVLSGAVQAFVSKDQMRRRLGKHDPASVARASGYGMVSSSCSYAASAMAKSLITKGADFTSSMVFMFASTNLVIELGIVMLVLLGWQFMAAEFVGGPIMIALLALVGGSVFTAKLVSSARQRAAESSKVGHDHGSHGDHSMNVTDGTEALDDADSTVSSARTMAGWSDASSYAVADATMLRKELLIGYTVAGLLAVLVPQSFWNGLFISGHGFWSSLENVLVGPLIAIISWVCSIGNVPLAAALWSGGISFGGVIAFIFADLIAMPLLIIYRKFYGSRVMWRMLFTFYGVMAVAGLLTEGIFSALHLIPERTTIEPGSAHIAWNYTTFLNIVFIALAIGVWWLARHRARFGGGAGYAIDPICSMQVRKADAPATARHAGTTWYFCSERCRDRFLANPARPSTGDASTSASGAHDTDPVCGMTVDRTTAADHRSFDGRDFWFCAPGCAQTFDEAPDRFAAGAAYEPMGGASVGIAISKKPLRLAVDPVCGMTIDTSAASAHRKIGANDFWFCSTGCVEQFDDQDASSSLEASPTEGGFDE